MDNLMPSKKKEKMFPAITRAQHVFPRASIERFCNTGSKVCVVRRWGMRCERKWRGPGESIFCVERAWSQKAELDFQKIESDYQKVANLFTTQVGALNAKQSATVSDMYWLWNLRCHVRDAPQTPIKLNGVTGDASLSPDERARAERMCVVTVDENGTVPAREFYGDQIALGMLHSRRTFYGMAWCCLQFSGGNVIVPDRFYSFGYLPLSPTRVFIVSTQQGMSLEKLNELALKEVQSYCFFHAPADAKISAKLNIEVKIL